MKRACELRAQARRCLRGKWRLAVGVALVATLLSGGIGVTNSGGGTSANDGYLSSAGHETWIMLLTISVTSVLIAFCIGGAIYLGWSKFNLKLVRSQQPVFRDLFSCFDRLWAGFCMVFLIGLFIFLWSLLLFIPGIIASYRYALTPYLMADDPELGVLDAIRKSKQLMKGNKWRLFCLQMSFFGWALLTALTFGIGALWLTPYIQAAHAAFYEDVLHGGERILEEPTREPELW